MHVCIDGRFGEVEGETGDCTGCVGAHAGEISNRGRVCGEFALVLTQNCLSGSVQVSCSGVVAEAFPCSKDLLLLGICERFEGGETLNPPLEVGDDRDDLRLLEHELGDEDFVGIEGLSPRQRAGAAREPVDESRRQSWIGGIFGREGLVRRHGVFAWR